MQPEDNTQSTCVCSKRFQLWTLRDLLGIINGVNIEGIASETNVCDSNSRSCMGECGKCTPKRFQNDVNENSSNESNCESDENNINNSETDEETETESPKDTCQCRPRGRCRDIEDIYFTIKEKRVRAVEFNTLKDSMERWDVHFRSIFAFTLVSGVRFRSWQRPMDGV